MIFWVIAFYGTAFYLLPSKSQAMVDFLRLVVIKVLQEFWGLLSFYNWYHPSHSPTPVATLQGPYVMEVERRGRLDS